MPLPPLRLLAGKVLSRALPRLPVNAELEAAALSRDPAVVDAYLHDPLVLRIGTPRTAMGLIAAIDWTLVHAAELALPSLIVHGGADRLALPQASQAFYAGVTFADRERIESDGYYHEVFNDLGKEQVLADVEAWAARHP